MRARWTRFWERNPAPEKRFRFSWALLLFALPCTGLASVELVDFTQSKVVLERSPLRVVALAPSLGELAADLLQEDTDRIVGVSDYTDFPASISKLPSVGPYHAFNLEKVVALKPDLVLATIDGNPKSKVLRLRSLGIEVLVVSTSTFKEVLESIQLVGRALGRSAQATQLIVAIRNKVGEIKLRAKSLPRKRVLLQVGSEPLVVVGKTSFLHEALSIVGGVNVYGDQNKRYPRPSIEDVLRRDPERIVVLSMDKAQGQKAKGKWSRFGALRAVRSGSIEVLHADELLRPSSRIMIGLDKLSDAVQGSSKVSE